MIKIEVTGNSIPEVADKLLAIGYSLRATPAVFEHEYKHQTVTLGTADAAKTGQCGSDAPVDPVMPEVAEMAAVDPTPAVAAVETASSPSDTATAQPETTESSATSTSTAASAESSASDAMSFDKDVAPFVLQVVKEKGKPAAEEILSQFGVTKASALDAAQWPELVAALKDAL